MGLIIRVDILTVNQTTWANDKNIIVIDITKHRTFKHDTDWVCPIYWAMTVLVVVNDARVLNWPFNYQVLSISAHWNHGSFVKGSIHEVKRVNLWPFTVRNVVVGWINCIWPSCNRNAGSDDSEDRSQERMLKMSSTMKVWWLLKHKLRNMKNCIIKLPLIPFIILSIFSISQLISDLSQYFLDQNLIEEINKKWKKNVYKCRYQILVIAFMVLSIKSFATFDIWVWHSLTLLPFTKHSFACLETYISLNSNGFIRSSTLLDFSWVHATNLSTLLEFLSKHWSMAPVSFSLIRG